MNTKRTLFLLVTTVLTLVVNVLPVLATEGADQKSQVITRSPHHIVGTFILGVGVLFVVMAIGNAIRQLRGERGQADGKFRWR